VNKPGSPNFKPHIKGKPYESPALAKGARKGGRPEEEKKVKRGNQPHGKKPFDYQVKVQQLRKSLQEKVGDHQFKCVICEAVKEIVDATEIICKECTAHYHEKEKQASFVVERN